MEREGRNRVNEEWTLSIVESFKENKNIIFWKGVNEVKKGGWKSLRWSSVRKVRKSSGE